MNNENRLEPKAAQNDGAAVLPMHLLTKSDFKVAQSCLTKLFYKKQGYPSINDENEYLRLLSDGGYMVEKIARLLFPDGIEVDFEKGTADAFSETQAALSAKNVVLFEATLISAGKVARVDILRKTGDTLDLYEIKAKSYDGAAAAERAEAGEPKIFRGKKGGIASKWQPYLDDIAFNVAVLAELFPESTIRPWLILPDTSKTTGIDQIHSLFRLNRIKRPNSKFERLKVDFLGDPAQLEKDHFLAIQDVSEEVAELLPDVRSSSAAYLQTLVPHLCRVATPISITCKECEFHASASDGRDGFKECWGDLADVKPNIFDLYKVGSLGGHKNPTANLWIKQGKTHLLDVSADEFVDAHGETGPDNLRRRIQLESTRHNQEWKSDTLEPLLRSFSYPLHFIDFETSAMAIPYHSGMHPYEQVAFQWSCHTINLPDAQPVHTEWINVEECFPNFSFAETLRKHLGTKGTVFMWATHERTVLKEIAQQLQRRGEQNASLSEWLAGMSERLVDMNALCLKHYFHPQMKGRTSIKVVLEAIWKNNPELRQKFPSYIKEVGGVLQSPYTALPPLVIDGQDVTVKEGTGAIRAYQAMLYGIERDQRDVREQWKKLLLQYCELDTLAMVMIWLHWTARNGDPLALTSA